MIIIIFDMKIIQKLIKVLPKAYAAPQPVSNSINAITDEGSNADWSTNQSASLIFPASHLAACEARVSVELLNNLVF